jgi:hypothetical protein
MALIQTWTFPLPRTHTGLLQGNGRLGLMIWGEGNVLRVTVGRADFWDRRGGTPFTDRMSFTNIRRCLEANDEAGIKSLFAETSTPGQPRRPTLLPIGRLELHFDPSLTLDTGVLHFDDGHAEIRLRDAAGDTKVVGIDCSMSKPAFTIQLGDGLAAPKLVPVTSWSYEHVRKQLGPVGYAAPQVIEQAGVAGFVMQTPADGAAAFAFGIEKTVIAGAVELGVDAGAATKAAAQLARDTLRGGTSAVRRDAAGFFAGYWRDVPKVNIPDAAVAQLYHYGVYKLAGLTHPDGVAAGLQGPWIEEYTCPPWSGDYHFNINVQMCYGPAYACNRLSHLRPLFDLVWSWEPRMREYARKFVGIDDGYMLPHAVDDRCTIIGAFWTGTIDHACTAWVAKMMFDYYAYGASDGKAFLRDKAYPFMRGAMKVYQRMLEKDPKGGKWTLPVSVSPEYRGAAMNAWGRNASFQLAAIHMLAEALQQAAAALGEQPDPTWQQLRDELPKATVQRDGDKDRIMLWEGVGLEESHRHHSHLAALTPFDVIDPADPQWKQVVDDSIRRWVFRGPGMWSGWCMPWAAQIHTRLNNADMAVLTLEIWRRVFTNEGYGTLHDVNFPGFTLLGARPPGVPPEREIMQMDAGLGATTAIVDLLLHRRAGGAHGTHYLFAGCPAVWRDVSFDGIRCTGGVLASAARANGKVTHVTLKPDAGATTFVLRDPFGGAAFDTKGAGSATRDGTNIAVSLDGTGELTLTPRG